MIQCCAGNASEGAKDGALDLYHVWDAVPCQPHASTRVSYLPRPAPVCPTCRTGVDYHGRSAAGWLSQHLSTTRTTSHRHWHRTFLRDRTTSTAGSNRARKCALGLCESVG